MDVPLRELPVLALDCQAAGATPAHGDLIELGWAICERQGVVGPVHSRWIVPRTGRPIRRPIRELTGWSEACLTEAVEEGQLWAALCDEIRRSGAQQPAPSVIHFARFELAFLRDLHERRGSGEFPIDAVCLHAIAARLLPDLPRRNIRALAGYLGFSPGLSRRSAGHVEASAFIWHALLPALEDAGVNSWPALKDWLDRPAPRPAAPRTRRRSYPLPPERRRALPDHAGVYRFVRRSGEVIYVGKARSLRKRVAGHFKARGPTTERGLELLTQVHDIDYTETASWLEAAVLETDEIKRLDPPYNVQLRTAERSAWFAARDLTRAAPRPDAEHRVGPLPSERALVGLAALIALADGAEPAPRLLAGALAVPATLLPPPELFAEGLGTFAAEWLPPRPGVSGARRVLDASRVIWLQRGRAEPESADDMAQGDWDLPRVRRRLERSLVQGGLLVRRARALCLLADADVAFREPDAGTARLLVIAHGRIVERTTLNDVAELQNLRVRPAPPLFVRQGAFDAATYDRLRVVLTELRRIHDSRGQVTLRVGAHVLRGAALAHALRAL